MSSLKIAAWERLPIESILNLCKSSRELAQICADPTTWNILLKRDYDIEYRGQNALTEYTKNLIRDIVSLLYEISELPRTQYTLEYREANELKIALEFLGHSNTNRYSAIHGNKIGSKAVSQLKSLTLSSLVQYRQILQDEIEEFRNAGKRQEEERKRRENEEKRREEEEEYLEQHGMFGLLE